MSCRGGGYGLLLLCVAACQSCALAPEAVTRAAARIPAAGTMSEPIRSDNAPAPDALLQVSAVQDPLANDAPLPGMPSAPADEGPPPTASPESTDLPYPINLATALRLADARPLIVAAAQASAWVAEAQLQRAQVLWVPELDLGAVYIRHDGFGPDFNRGVNHPSYGFPGGGGPLNQNIHYFYAGGSIYQVVNVTDAVFEPLAARQVLNARRWDIQTAKNDALLATANAYFSVHQFRGQYAGALDVVARGRKLVERISILSQDLVPRVEVDRAKSQLLHVEQKAVSAREAWRVASADLTQILRLDPRVVVEPAEPDHLQITLIEPDRPINELVAIGVANRPEIGSQKSNIQAAEQRVLREKYRPLLPLVLLTGFQTPGHMRMQAGVFGTGFDRNLDLWSFRNDVSFQLAWQLEGFGFGNLARIKDQRGQESQAIVKLFRMQDTVSAEVTEAQARLQSASVRVLQAERALQEARKTFDGCYEGLSQTKRFDNVLIEVYRPQEAVIALDRMTHSYDEYFATVADYNRAQFALFHALGYPASEVTSLNPPGEIMPVDLNRPGYLPFVEDGPPPSDR